ncbi:O-antigen ligase family protein [Enterobacteriaceae bacterium 89]|nr:O-antigen ligase family protein [Enterobacteriaceae bacterium 89]
MHISKISDTAQQSYRIVFPLFLFFSSIFCMSTRANNLFHLSLLLLIVSLFNKDNRQILIGHLRQYAATYSLLIVFFIYYALSNLWGNPERSISSPLTHGTYITFYLLLLPLMLNRPETRRLTLMSIVAGLTVLSIWTLITEHELILTIRQTSDAYPGPSNVIDIAGYCGIGILISGMLMKEKYSPLLLLPMVILAVMMLFTQSRGPVIALFLSACCLLHRHSFKPRNIIITAVLLIVIAAVLFFSHVGEMLLSRFEVLDGQSGLRISIWDHTLAETAKNPWFGHGFNYGLDFINYSGEHITTTHSVYLGALLKGGIIGFVLLMAIVIGGLFRAWNKRESDNHYSLAIFVYALIFMSSQGMFLISNPRETWILFWFPLGLTLSHRLTKKQ